MQQQHIYIRIHLYPGKNNGIKGGNEHERQLLSSSNYSNWICHKSILHTLCLHFVPLIFLLQQSIASILMCVTTAVCKQDQHLQLWLRSNRRTMIIVQLIRMRLVCLLVCNAKAQVISIRGRHLNFLLHWSSVYALYSSRSGDPNMSTTIAMDSVSSSQPVTRSHETSILLSSLSRGTGVLAGCGQYIIQYIIEYLLQVFTAHFSFIR